MLALLHHSYYKTTIGLVEDLCRPLIYIKACYSYRLILLLAKISVRMWQAGKQARLSSLLYQIDGVASIAVIKGVLSHRYIWEDAPGIGGFGVFSRRFILIAGRRSQLSWIRWTYKAVLTSLIHCQRGAHPVDILSAICMYITWFSSSEWTYCLINTV